MPTKKTFFIVGAFAAALMLALSLFNLLALPVAAATLAPAPQAPAALPLVADFEGGAPAGWFQYDGGGSSVTPATPIIGDADPLALPGQQGNNQILTAAFNLPGGSWGGFGAEFSPKQDWTDYDALTFDFYGANSGLTYVVEVQDGTAAAVERFHATFVDDFSGWRQIVLPFDAFYRSAYQEGGPPDDGFQLEAVAAWVFPLPTGSSTLALDNLELVNLLPLADFESGAPAGWFQYDGGGSTVAPATPIISDADPLALPGQVGDNGILSATFNLPGGSWGGFGAEFNPYQDWSDLEGISFWFYGQNSGLTYVVELQDGTAAAVERFHATFVDDFSGWRQIVLPFDTFYRSAYQEGGPPDDGFQLEAIAAWVFPLPTGSGQVIMDNLSVYGDAGNVTLKVQFEQSAYSTPEGSGLVLTVTLTAVSTETVTVDYATADGSAGSADYEAASGTLTFDPGVLVQTVALNTTEDSEVEGQETFSVLLSNPQNIILGTRATAEVTIRDNDDPNPSTSKIEIIDDFELDTLPSGLDGTAEIGFVTWNAAGAAIAITTTVPPTQPEGLDAGNRAMQMDLTVGAGQWAGFTHAFANETTDEWVPQDWSRYEGVAFWLYGQNTGGTLFMDILDNRNPGSTIDDAERWSYDIADDFTGWKFFQIPFGEFNRKDVGNGAPNDGFNLTQIHGYAIGAYGSVPMGSQTYYADQVGLVVRTTVIDDFEEGQLPNGMDGTVEIGFATWNAPAASAAISITTPPVQPDGLDAGNQTLQLDVTVAAGEWAGFTHAFENETVDEWVNQDWSSYEGICFWLYGQNTGGTLFMDILDNRNPDSTTDDAERWSYDIPDDFSGWRFFQVPFTEFNRKDIGNGAPNDGFNLTEVHGYGIGAYGSVPMGSQTYYVDNVTIYGNTGADAPLTVGFAETEYTGGEGETVLVTVTLNMTSTMPVTVSYKTVAGTAGAERDYVPTSGLLVFPAGTMEQVIAVETLEDIKFEGDERFQLLLTDPISATMAFQQRAVVLIEENDPFDPLLLDDFEGFHRFAVEGDVELSVMEIAAGDALAVPGQGSYEQVLKVEYAPAASNSLSRTFETPQDWSGSEGLSFWFYGDNSGDTISLTLLDNQLTTTADVAPEGWELVWSDEFNTPAGTLPNPNNWSHEIGDGAANGIPGWGNGELEFYTKSPENAATDGQGNLVITAREVNTETTQLPCWYGLCEYTSARLLTANKVEVEYGRVEARMQLPTGQGLWPAFWMLGIDINQVGWPQSGEIDIMENIGREPDMVHGTVHGPGYSGGAGIGGSYSLDSGIFADAFHTFALEWEPDELRWYVDGELFFTLTPDDIPAGTEWVYDHPFFILLNVAVGGNWPGYPDGTATFPQTLTVDYVRVYQAENASERFEASFVDNFSGWQKVTIPFSQFSRSAEQPAGAPDDGLGLTEVWGYGLELPTDSTGSFLIDYVALADVIGRPDYTLQYFPLMLKD